MLDICVNHKLDPEQLDRVLRVFERTHQRTEDRLMSALSDLHDAVAAQDAVIASAIVLINGIADRIAAAGTDQSALNDITNDIRSHADSLAAAVTANTPTPVAAAPAPAPVEAPAPAPVEAPPPAPAPADPVVTDPVAADPVTPTEPQA